MKPIIMIDSRKKFIGLFHTSARCTTLDTDTETTWYYLNLLPCVSICWSITRNLKAK